MVLEDDSGFVGSPRVIPNMVDGRVGEVEPHGCVENIPAGEVAVIDCMLCTWNLDADFKIIAGVRVNCESNLCKFHNASRQR